MPKLKRARRTALQALAAKAHLPCRRSFQPSESKSSDLGSQPKPADELMRVTPTSAFALWSRDPRAAMASCNVQVGGLVLPGISLAKLVGWRVVRDISEPHHST